LFKIAASDADGAKRSPRSTRCVYTAEKSKNNITELKAGQFEEDKHAQTPSPSLME
jgi:hypothetical protein